MSSLTIQEFDLLAAPRSGEVQSKALGVHVVPVKVYGWLEEQCLRNSENGDRSWLRFTQRGGTRAIQVTSFVGVLRSPDGFQIEVLPKIGKKLSGGSTEARQLLVEMLCCLHGFRHVQTENAKLFAARMPLLEVFIAEFLRTIEQIIKRGIRGDYVLRQDNLFALRGKLLVGQHLRHNICRADRFFSEHDDFSKNRPENRLLHSAVSRALSWSVSSDNQQRARELRFVFAEVPQSDSPKLDFKRIGRDRGLRHYSDALAWARLILGDRSPLTGSGGQNAPSLLFPMEAVFEAFVAKHLARQLKRPMFVKTQVSGQHLVRHRDQDWFRLKPDLLVRDTRNHLILDTKWKLLDENKANSSGKYDLSQSDFYQLHSYGICYLDGEGDVVLIYPRTKEFDKPLPMFEFPKSNSLRLWVLPFCIKSKILLIPDEAPFRRHFA